MKRRDELNTSMKAAAGWIVVLLVVSSAVLTTACSSTPKADQPATLIYVGSPDDTWTAMQIVLIDLDYDVESEDRNEGKIRAVREATGDRPTSVLTIDQIWRQDTISIYVRAFAATGEQLLTLEERDSLTKEFLDPVKELLY